MAAKPQSAKELVDGKWDQVLKHAGLDDAFFGYTRSEGPCPMCGGRTRFRFYDVKSGKHFCNGCGMAQDGWRLLRHLLGITDPFELSDWVRHEWAQIEKVEPSAFVRSGSGDASDESTWPALQAKYAREWEAGKPIQEGSPAWLYRKLRCPDAGQPPAVLRQVDQLKYWVANDDETARRTGKKFSVLGTFAGMLALVQGPDGAIVNVNRWYLNADGTKADVPKVKKLAGGIITRGSYAVRLAEPDDCLAVTESVENAENIMAMRGVACWATLGKVGMTRFALPAGYERVKRVDFYGDNDQADQHGRRAGNDAARAARDNAKRAGLKSSVHLPSSTSYDYADIGSGAALKKD